MSTIQILGGEVQLFKRTDSAFWWCAATIEGKQRRTSTKQTSAALASEIATDWYLTQMGKSRAGLLLSEKTFQQAAAQFQREYEIITAGERSPLWVKSHELRLRLHLLPFFGAMGVSQITAGTVQEYRIHRMTSRTDKEGKPLKPSRSTLHDEVGTLRQVLKTAARHKWLSHVPDLAPPYKTQGKISHRPWFSPDEYKQLYEATRAYAREPQNPRFKWNAEQVHDFVLFMANTGLRPDEAKNLQHRDVTIADDEDTGETILEIEVRGKRGVGYCKSMPNAVKPYARLLARARPVGPSQTKRARRQRGEDGGRAEPYELRTPEPTDRVFPGNHIKLFNGVLARAGLKVDRDGKRRTAYSLRHTYICLRLMDRANVYDIAKNCRTSVEMIEKFYAAHLKNTLDAAAINVRRPKKAVRNAKQVPRRDDDDEVKI